MKLLITKGYLLVFVDRVQAHLGERIVGHEWGGVQGTSAPGYAIY
jgi:hypothetical protein